MAPQEPTTNSGEADIAKALQELARGEQTASMLENQLSALELKIDALLASAESEPTFSQDNQNETQGSEGSKAAEKK